MDERTQDRFLDALLAHIRRERGMDCTQFRSSFLRRRLAVRMWATESNTYQEYLSVLH